METFLRGVIRKEDVRRADAIEMGIASIMRYDATPLRSAHSIKWRISCLVAVFSTQSLFLFNIRIGVLLLSEPLYCKSPL